LASKKKRERLSEGGAAARPCSATDAALLHAALGIVTRGLKPDGRRAAPTAEIYELEAPLLARLVWPYAEGTLAVAVRARARRARAARRGGSARARARRRRVQAAALRALRRHALRYRSWLASVSFFCLKYPLK
jgi:hypothetical protein